MLRMDAGFARLSVLIAQSAQMKHQTGRALTMSDFMVYVDDAEPAGLTLESAMMALGVKKRG